MSRLTASAPNADATAREDALATVIAFPRRMQTPSDWERWMERGARSETEAHERRPRQRQPSRSPTTIVRVLGGASRAILRRRREALKRTSQVRASARRAAPRNATRGTSRALPDSGSFPHPEPAALGDRPSETRCDAQR